VDYGLFFEGLYNEVGRGIICHLSDRRVERGPQWWTSAASVLGCDIVDAMQKLSYDLH